MANRTLKLAFCALLASIQWAAVLVNAKQDWRGADHENVKHLHITTAVYIRGDCMRKKLESKTLLAAPTSPSTTLTVFVCLSVLSLESHKVADNYTRCFQVLYRNGRIKKN